MKSLSVPRESVALVCGVGNTFIACVTLACFGKFFSSSDESR